jgi:hypothetical protein
LGVADPDTRVPREIDEKELEAIRAKYPAPPSPPPAPPPPPPPPPAGSSSSSSSSDEGPAPMDVDEPPPAPAPAPTIHRPSSDAEKAQVDGDGWIVKALYKEQEDWDALLTNPAYDELRRGRTIEQLESAMATWMCYGNLSKR